MSTSPPWDPSPYRGRNPLSIIHDLHDAARATLERFAALRIMISEGPLPISSIKDIVHVIDELDALVATLGPALETVAGWWVADSPPAFAPRRVSVAEAILVAAVDLLTRLRDCRADWFKAVKVALDEDEARQRLILSSGPAGSPASAAATDAEDDVEDDVREEAERARLDALLFPSRGEFALLCRYASERVAAFDEGVAAAALTCEAAVMLRHAGTEPHDRAGYRESGRRLRGAVVSGSFPKLYRLAFDPVYTDDFGTWLQSHTPRSPSDATPKSVSPLSETDLEILTVLAKSGELTSTRIVEKLTSDRSHVFRRLRKLEKDNRIVRDGARKPYRLAGPQPTVLAAARGGAVAPPEK